MSNSIDWNLKPVVMDNGTGLSKVGFGGDDEPNLVIPTVVGLSKPLKRIETSEVPLNQCKFGNSVLQDENVYEIIYPIRYGTIEDWVSMERYWNFIFEDALKVDPSKQPILLSDRPASSRNQRLKMIEIMFETFRVPAMRIDTQPLLALYASGKTTGCVVDIGEGVCHIVPFYEGFALSHVSTRIDLAGRDITQNLEKLIERNNSVLSEHISNATAKDIKEKLCFVAFDDADRKKLGENNGVVEKDYILPDGRTLKIGKERFMAPECLFEPSVVGKNNLPLDEEIVRSILQCEEELQKELFMHIVLSGGSTMFTGLKERLMNEIKKRLNDVDVRIICPPNRNYSAWIGGSILSSLKTFSSLWATQEQYFDRGAEGISLRFF